MQSRIDAVELRGADQQRFTVATILVGDIGFQQVVQAVIEKWPK